MHTEKHISVCECLGVSVDVIGMLFYALFYSFLIVFIFYLYYLPRLETGWVVSLKMKQIHCFLKFYGLTGMSLLYLCVTGRECFALRSIKSFGRLVSPQNA